MAVREPLAGPALGGSRTPRAVVSLGAIPVPGFDAAFTWRSNAAGAALGQAALGGATSLTFPSSGILVVPDLDAGTIVIQAWWAYATQFTVTRVDADGSRVPVRDADAWTVIGARTRRNLAAHPTNAAGDLVGWTAGTNTTLGSLTTLDVQPDDGVTTGVRATATAAGAANVTFGLDIVSPLASTYGLWIRGDVAPSSAAVTVQWYDVNGSAVGTSSYPIGATALAETVRGWSWCQAQISGYPFGAVFGIAGLTAAGLAAGAILDLTGRLWETGTRLGPYFDGSYFGGNWVGTPLKSASTFAPVQLIVDAEAPLDRPVSYEVTCSAAPGYTAASTEVTLTSERLIGPRQCLLTHPGLDATLRVWITDAPVVEEDIDQASFQVIGRKRKVVVSAPQRAGAEGQLEFFVESMAERALLSRLFATGDPLLLRMPASFGYPPLWWLSFGKLTTTPNMRRATHEPRRLTAPFVEVDRPSTASGRISA